jgi:CRP-like cAMP-binding protein
MHQKLIGYINSHIDLPLNNEEVILLQTAFRPVKLRKNQYYLQEGNVCKHLGFIVEGAMRQYSVDDKGVEHIVQLFIENYWVSDRESAVMLTPSIYNIDAWENTVLLNITRMDMLELMVKIPSLVKMVQLMDERHAIAYQKRLNSTISNPAERRYDEFARNHPQFIQRFPQHLIASFLGITKETLSRVRNQARK